MQGSGTYNRFLLEDFLAFLRQCHGQDGRLPPGIAPGNLNVHSTANDLVTKADANQTHAILGKDLLGEVDKLQDPGLVVKRIVFCMRRTISTKNSALRLHQHSLDPVKRMASTSARAG